MFAHRLPVSSTLARQARLFVVAALALVPEIGACKSPAGSAPLRDGGAKDSPVTDAGKDSHLDAASNPGACAADAGPPSKGKSERCACNSECRSGFCVDGVCCTSACGERCKACNLPNALGDCSLIPAGVAPSDRATCAVSTPATCGQDGTCDGKGGCRLFVAGTVCDTGACDGDGLSGMRTCDGKGACSGRMSKPCVPYSCDPSSRLCDGDCTTNAQCAAGQQCTLQSCGMKLNGFACASDADCASSHCASGVCCNVACNGPCVSCDQTGSVGRCRFVPAGLPDPSCPAHSVQTCGTTGRCDGSGACAIYPETTPCSVSLCAGPTLLSTAAACDGKGTCEQPQLVDCSPFLCVAGTCSGSCKSDADCAPGHACVLTGGRGGVTGTCGKKKNGQTCSAASDCESAYCVDGLCCESGCQGACRSCALPGSPGQCVAVPTGAPDPRRSCIDEGRASCGENGVCDGKGACQPYPAGTECGAASCVGGSFTAPPVCNQAGQCVAPPSRTCSPYVCNGSAACFASCTKDADCVAGTFCVGGSCGKKPNGADCSGAGECQSGFCAQGVCCNSACDGVCKACNLPTSSGLCSAVPDGAPDPQSQCKALPQSSCGTTGTCAAGACAFVAKGLPCKGATCASPSSLTPGSSCDGQGRCVTPPDVSCGTFVCSGSACLSSCSRDSDCVAPSTCVNNACGLKPNGAVCTVGADCGTGICTEGVCCDSACGAAAQGGLCMSCKVSGKVGTCSPVRGGGPEPRQRCVASNAAAGDCSNDGTCNGKGACRPWSTSTGCQQASCSGSTFSPAATCDGAGNCAATTASNCAPYRCSGTSPSCLTTCTSDADCVSGETCLKVSNRCGDKLANGQSCKASSDCSSNVCSEGVCCNVACNGACQSCSLASKPGTCSNIAVGGSPRDNTTCAAGSTCGNTGKCNGAGGCQLTAADTVCGSATCAAPTAGTVNGSAASESLAQVPAPTCDGSGNCQAGSPVSCGAYQCNASNGQCKSTCGSTTADCNALAPSTANSAGGNSCIGSTCQKQPSGVACSADYACASGHCVDGVCCGTATCGACMACNLANGTGKVDGICRAVAAGTAEPHGLCAATVSSSCGTDGKCNGAGACEMWTGSTCTPSQSPCPDATHQAGSTGTCNGSGVCTSGASVACKAGYLCAAGLCATACTSDTACDTSNGYGCFGGACLKKNGQSCSLASECGSGNCVGSGGVGSICCAGACVDKACGSKAICLASGAGCQTHQGDTCGAAACSADLRSSLGAGTCDGSGSCVAPAPVACASGYLCSNGACASRCSTNADCDVTNGFACVGSACRKLSANGTGCTADTDCSSGHCISSGNGSGQICCAVACANTTCGTKAQCAADGSGCQTHNGESCAATTCSSDLRAVLSSTCNAAGSCVTASSACTAGYLCAAGVCATTCTGDSACDVAAGFSCNKVSQLCVRVVSPVDGGGP